MRTDEALQGPAAPSETGEWQVLVVRHGTRSATRSEVFLNYGLYGEPIGPHTVDYYFWVLRSRDRTILIDTGYAAGPAARRDRTVLVDPVQACRELGIDPDSPIEIVVTHGHWDHIGNLDAFPAATVVIAQAELDFWASETSRRVQLGHFAERSEVDALGRLAAEGRVLAFEGALDLAPGVRLIEVGGHTPGQCMVLVETDEGSVLLASDVVHFREELERQMPFVSVVDLERMYAGFATIDAMVSAGEVDVVVPGHDADVLSTVRALELPDGSRLVGLIGVIGNLRATAVERTSDTAVAPVLEELVEAAHGDPEFAQIARFSRFAVVGRTVEGGSGWLRVDRGLVTAGWGSVAPRSPEHLVLQGPQSAWIELTDSAAAPRRHDLLALTKAHDGLAIVEGRDTLVRHLRVLTRLVELLRRGGNTR